MVLENIAETYLEIFTNNIVSILPRKPRSWLWLNLLSSDKRNACRSNRCPMTALDIFRLASFSSSLAVHSQPFGHDVKVAPPIGWFWS